MKKTVILITLCAISTKEVYAGGMSLSGQSITPLFEKGTYIELSAYSFDPEVSGKLTNSIHSGNVAKKGYFFSGAYKQDLPHSTSMAIIIDQPFGADIRYPSSSTYPLSKTSASVDTTAIKGIIRYKINTPFSVYGGLRNVTSNGEVTVNQPSNHLLYTMKTDTQNDWGYLFGAAYEIPEIALRASLTYNSAIKVKFKSQENIVNSSLARETSFNTDMPKSVNFDFQMGVSQSTLLMFSARWVEWKKTKITPQLFTQFVDVGNNLVDFKDNTITYSLGLGQKLTDTLTGSLTIAYEEPSEKVASNLSPSDGYTSLIAGLKYQATPNTAIATGVSYTWIGEAKTNLSSNEATFENNHSMNFGVKLSHHF
ncbi:outer membrane protein transport protein [Marinomonas rhizomae]|uniref:OmpP1/FadL family transporter n=1 Tax=Marinomonas rhizomae TaxID=491948 RepID=UPI00210217E6|nr:outer membrane protein transport protein [Marinomonas rhizomae]UTW00518.1 outer membrane protein transport protein [Marinomonas rhizomae]